jgi:hypothetical protein
MSDISHKAKNQEMEVDTQNKVQRVTYFLLALGKGLMIFPLGPVSLALALP